MIGTDENRVDEAIELIHEPAENDRELPAICLLPESGPCLPDI